MRKTYNCEVIGCRLIAQADLERLKADDPCWRGKVWVTYEKPIEPYFSGGLAIKAIKLKVPKPETYLER